MLQAAPEGRISGPASEGIPKRQRRRPGAALRLAPPDQRSPGTVGAALLKAYTGSGVTMTELARQLGLSVSQVSRLIKAAESEAKGKT